MVGSDYHERGHPRPYLVPLEHARRVMKAGVGTEERETS